MKPAIRVANISKRYRLGSRTASSYRTLRETITDSFAGALHGFRRRFGGTGNGAANGSAKDDAFWALKDVSLEVQPGEVVGIIGRNGAGKSTLLKILSRITEPTAGRCQVRGRVASLLEVGTGFHPELTGRENIYLNASILGMSRVEVQRNFDEIVSFADIEQFLETPIKRYSSGMYVRLAFAVAAHLNPEILLVDEVLAVGDQSFQRKCLSKMSEMRHSGRTILLVSHNMAAIQKLCKTSVVLEHGRLEYQGATDTAVRLHVQTGKSSDSCDVNLSSHPDRPAICQRVFQRVRLLNSDGKLTDQLLCGDPLIVEVTLAATTYSNLQITISFEDVYASRLFTVSTWMLNESVIPACGGRLRCRISEVSLVPGRYYLTLRAGITGLPLDRFERIAHIDVNPSDYFGTGRILDTAAGCFLVRHDWQMMESQ